MGQGRVFDWALYIQPLYIQLYIHRLIIIKIGSDDQITTVNDSSRLRGEALSVIQENKVI